MRDEYTATGVTPYIVGFENSEEDGEGPHFNLILSNGARSKQKDKGEPTKYTHMIPKHAGIRSVTLYHDARIRGFEFFDKEKARIWSIGNTDDGFDVTTVVLAENEVMIGVVAKLYDKWHSQYTDFQFQLGKIE